ncbi:sortase [Rubrobacter aplysinae]|uniref:sortase n=1 Tax=Rubrobacter aplysinae TaxID=909625 RepID=UPI00064C076C|nr:class E sortase [Rubrobacter aplysinae]
MRRIGLYSLIALASLALVGVLAAGIGVALNNDDQAKVKQASTPTVAEPESPETTEETKKEETKEEKTKEDTKKEETEEETANEEQQAAEQQAAEQQAAQEQRWRELAEQREAEERDAAQRRAAEQQAAEEEQPAVPANTALSLSAPTAGIQNDPVTNSIAEGVLATGAGKIPSTGFPWQSGANTFIAAHVYGYPGTGSWQQFARVPNMGMGDPIYLTDSNGTTYEYQVSEILTVAPTDVWVAESTGQNIVSLQTCVGPNWSQRMVVRGTLVGTSQA